MDYHLLTKKCDGMCDSCECPPAEFECQGEPGLCDNPRGCGCQEPSEPHPSCKTPEGCRENGCLGWCDEHRPEAGPDSKTPNDQHNRQPEAVRVDAPVGRGKD